MAEAEDVITDAARHATVYVQALWRRHRPAAAGPRLLRLADVSRRLDLLIAAVFGRSFPLRVAQLPAPPTFLVKTFRRGDGPLRRQALPATDGTSLWLPDAVGPESDPTSYGLLRTMALQQAMRADRGSAGLWPRSESPLVRDLYLLVEAHACDAALGRLLPGLDAALDSLRRAALLGRPALPSFPPRLQPLETMVRSLLQAPGAPAHGIGITLSPAQSLEQARAVAARLSLDAGAAAFGPHPLFKDAWTGELRAPPPAPARLVDADDTEAQARSGDPPRSARLARRPDVREAGDEEDDERQGAWMVQTAQPHEQMEDPIGMQRPTDRDETTAAEDFADAMSELPEARLVVTPGRPREVLLSDDPPESRGHRPSRDEPTAEAGIAYPEWDWRRGAYREPGAIVRLVPAALGPQAWVDETLARHRAMLQEIRRRFEMLRARRMRLRKQLDGEEIDLDAYTDSHADFRAGLPRAQALYQTQSQTRRDTAVMLLIDVSGSTDGWISAQRRIVDVEREALLLVCIALDGLGEPYAVQAFSGEGPQSVTLRAIKRFDEPHGADVARRIAGLEPEQYTRAGAAIRHATTLLMKQPAAHRLLLLLSDGKPNDIDEYEGRYGVEDMRQAVVEARLQGISPFCLTIDRQAANYLPAVFGASHYALLPRPELLPGVLLDWMRRLMT